MSGSPQRVFITGIAGCAGSHLAALAEARGAAVAGVDARTAPQTAANVRTGDIRSRALVDEAIKAFQPDWVFHLAALIPGPAATHAEDFVSVNVTGTLNVLEAVRAHVPAARVLVASSSAIYGRPDDPDRPIDEDAPLRPQSIYAVTKAAQDMLAMQYATVHGLHVLTARTFNQTGPREPDGLVCATIAAQIARVEVKLQEPIVRTITLAPCRDFTDVRDVVAGYWAALEHGAPGGAYNVCSGQAVTIRRVADVLQGLSRVPVEIVETGPPPPPQAILGQIGSFARLQQCSGWRPAISLEASLAALLDERRSRVAAAST